MSETAEDIRIILARIDNERTQTHDALVSLLAASESFVEIVDKAGLLNLSNGVQLGAMSWFVKASERLEWLRRTIARAGTIGAQSNPEPSAASATSGDRT